MCECVCVCVCQILERAASDLEAAAAVWCDALDKSLLLTLWSGPDHDAIMVASPAQPSQVAWALRQGPLASESKALILSLLHSAL